MDTCERGILFLMRHPQGFIQASTFVVHLPHYPHEHTNTHRMSVRSQDNRVCFILGRLRQRKDTVLGRAKKGWSVQLSFHPGGTGCLPPWQGATKDHRQPRKTPPNRIQESRGSWWKFAGLGSLQKKCSKCPCSQVLK